MVVENKKLNMSKIVRLYLLDNIENIKRSKSTLFRFESLLTHLFFYATKKFLGMTTCR